MKTCFVEHHFAAAQNTLYQGLQNCAWKSLTMARLYAAPTAIPDVILETAKTVARIFEAFLNAVVNLVGAYSYDECTLKEGLLHAQYGLMQVSFLPFLPITTAVKLLYQAAMNIYDPRNAQSINFAPTSGNRDAKTVTWKAAYPVRLSR